MSSHSSSRSYGKPGKNIPPRTPSESLGPTQPGTPSSSPTLTNMPNDKPSPSKLSEERGAPDASQCLFPIEWDKIRYNRKPVPSIRYRQPHKRAINSKSQPSVISTSRFVKRLTSVRMRFLPIIWKTSVRSSPKIRQLSAVGSKRSGLAMLGGAFG
jgi:hypothetical protein